MEEKLKQFEEEYINYVNASVLYLELNKDRDSINFEEEMEWIKQWMDER